MLEMERGGAQTLESAEAELDQRSAPAWTSKGRDWPTGAKILKTRKKYWEREDSPRSMARAFSTDQPSILSRPVYKEMDGGTWWKCPITYEISAHAH